jgi:aspartate/methionine/tyrosine aminotransferase
MSTDMQLARVTGEGEVNLAIGEPFFLQKHLLTRMWLPKQIPSSPLYPCVGGEEFLLDELRRLHHRYKYIVVTNGAKQAIEAAFYAFKQQGKTNVVHRVPYWPSYPTLARSQGLGFNVTANAQSITCITSPNNPDGYQDMAQTECDVWDAAYAHPLYGWKGLYPRARVAVYSAAKQLGLSGLRVGWLCTNEPELALAAGHLIEITTSGVSLPSQAYLAECLKAMRDPGQVQALTSGEFAAQAQLLANGSSFLTYLLDVCEGGAKGVPLTGSGMFAWFRAKEPAKFAKALVLAKVKLVTGEACGATEPGWYRMSMGHDYEVTARALYQIRAEVDAL